MFYKLSNTAEKDVIENEFNVKFEFSKLYRPIPIINGLKESNLSIITMDQPSTVKIGIWGILPQDLEDNWKVYQNLTNTLNINVEHLDIENSLYSQAFDCRRCIIIINGFFTSAMDDGKMYPYHVHLKDHTPFAVAGIYNQLEDGFITCSILINKTSEAMTHVPNMLSYIPVIFNKQDQGHWLNKSLKYTNLKDLIFSHQPLEYFSHKVSKEFYDNESVLNKGLGSSAFDDFLKSS
jgi:putative SOS response-associated peptidase YedK